LLSSHIILPTDWETFWPQMKMNLEAQREKELSCSSHDFVSDYVEVTDNTGMSLALREDELGTWFEGRRSIGKYCVHCGRYKEA